MLERTVGCLETSSIRRILPPSRKAVKSRRTLHSAFWNHAACALELPPLWAAILSDADARQEETNVEQKVSGSNGGILLDFLYPAGTLNYLRNNSSWGLEREGRVGRSGFSKLGQRLYSSSAVDIPPTGSSILKPDDSKSHGTQISEPTMEYLRKRMGLLRENDYDEAWRQYRLMETDEQKLLRKRLIVYYSTSKRIIDAERSLDLFHALAVEERDAMAFQNAIRSCLRLRNLQDAFQMIKSATENLSIPIGSDQIFSHLVAAGSWTRACTVWWDVKQWELTHPGTTYNLYAVVERHTTFDDLASNVIKYLNERYDQLTLATSDKRPALLDFATDLAKKAFNVRENFRPAKFSIIFDHVRRWSVVLPVEYEQILRGLTSLGHKSLVVSLYRRLRESGEFPFTRATLISLLKIFCDGHSTTGIEQVMEDFWNHHGSPSGNVYRYSMRVYVANGDAEKVHYLFQQSERNRQRTKQRPHKDPNFLTPLLQVHSKRGEISEVIKTFDSISERFGLQPNILCWNILIATYGRLQDFDGALACYQQLLAIPDLKPDCYTIGTLMGMATRRGDVETLLSLWRTAGELKIERSTAMVDMLVWTYIHEDKLAAAEKICEDAVNMDLKGTRTRMWNYLIVGFAQRRDLINTNRILQRMTKLQIPQDEFTYAALMQSLAMNKQPDQAYAIIQKVLPRAGLRASLYHYAIVMGGYLATNNIPRVFRIHQHLVRRLGHNSKAASVNALLLRAEARTDEWLLEQGTESEKFQRSMEMFLSITFNPADMARTPVTKGIYSLPLDIAYPASIHSFVMMNLAKHSETKSVTEVYERYMSAIPESRRQEIPPNMILSALMLSKFRDRDQDGVFECWDMILANARALKKSVVIQHPDESRASEKLQVLYQDQLVLSKSLSWYLRALAWNSMGDCTKVTATVEGLLEEGFVLDNHNWNKYVQILLSSSKVKGAFQVCEERLMPGFTGWSMVRRHMPVRNRLPKAIRDLRKTSRHLRPMINTQLALARAYISFRESAMESAAYQFWLEDLERLYPQTCQMIKTMRRKEDPMELMMLRDV
ncbi:hypothetical protein HYALB_00003451 [Hymenoscyphus albidus]|uniref:Uncharacterized protein n=1 Tax=Hymenoscyphus albidus TaxID=595503 RepID=A0A9N9Q279_9HELO|nr:hypothetical protein HYALB_00003451 [Hymenoscyphus albidus]